MMKIVCFFAVLAVALAEVRPVPPNAIPVRHPRALAQPLSGNENDQPTAPANVDMAASEASGDMDKAETFGFGYHKHIHVAPQYYGGYYGGYHGGYLGGYHGGYYPYYGHGYGGYPYYY